MKKQPRVFLSFANADRPFAEKLAEGLKKAGIIARDQTHLSNGDSVFESFRKELIASDLVVLIIPPREGEGRWALAEVGAAKALDKQILAIVPDMARYGNTAFARALTDSPLVNASELTSKALVDTIVSSMPIH